MTPEERRKYIAELWQDKTDLQLSELCQISRQSVEDIRRELGLRRPYVLPPKRAKNTAGKAHNTPSHPRGYSKEDLDWAELNARPCRKGGTTPDQEAGMMLILHADWLAIPIRKVKCSAVPGMRDGNDRNYGSGRNPDR
jgi:hypothetical protein